MSLKLHTKFHQIQPSGSWKEDFLKCFTVYEHGTRLGHVTSIILMNFISLYLQAYIQNLAEDGLVVTEKQLYFLFVNDLGQRSRNDLDRQYVYPH